MTPEERAGEIEMMIIREALSIAALGLVLLMLSPAVQIWARHKLWQARSIRRRRQDREDALIAELRRDISLIEHGGTP
jgi:hypothetical protein